MTKLTEKEREGFEKILSQDLNAINARFMSQIKDFWGIARNKVLETKGWDVLIREKDKLEEQKKQMVLAGCGYLFKFSDWVCDKI
jgi:hypothetical protein